MSRKELLQGAPRQLKETAKLMLDPAMIARCLDDFDQVLAFSRFAHQASDAESLGNLTRAKELVDAIKAELELMKRPRAGATELETRERAELIDGTYALTPEWRAAGTIMQRRRDLIAARSGPTVAMRTHIDSSEREIHEELAVRLSLDPRKYQGHHMINELRHLVESIDFEARKCANQPDESDAWEYLRNFLFQFVQQFDAIAIAQQLVIHLVVELEKARQSATTKQSDTHRDYNHPYLAEAQVVLAQGWPIFRKRDRSLLVAAWQRSGNELDPFLEYLEDRERGRAILAAWCEWATSADLQAFADTYETASYLLSRGVCADLLDEIEQTGEVDDERLDDGFSYLCEIGAIVVPGIEMSEDSDPPFLYRLPTDREQGKIPEGWEVLPSLKQLIEDDEDLDLSVGLGVPYSAN